MLKIRLQRTGRKHDPSFRVVLVDSRRGPKSGNFKEVLGNYDARKGEPAIDAERVKYWIGKGAQVSDTVHNLLIKMEIIEGEKIDVRPSVKKKEGDEKPAASNEKKPAEPATTSSDVGGEETPKEEPKEETKDLTEEKK